MKSSRHLAPLFTHLNETFEILGQTLTHSALIKVIARIWKLMLVTLESLLVPPLSGTISEQQPLTREELDIVFKWLEVGFHFIKFKHCKTKFLRSYNISFILLMNLVNLLV